LSPVRDIETSEDITLLIREFYSRLLTLEEFKPIFAQVDFEKHVPHIVHFWSFVLLDTEGYKTNVFEKHLPLPIKPHQFDIWLELFTASVDTVFKGEKADLAKQRATVLAFTFKNKWQAIKGN
jgi:hemoglobin